MNKTELLEKIDRLGACRPARVYIREHASQDAAQIISTCDRVDWLIWLLGRELRLGRFVRVCANRAAASSADSAYAVAAAAAAAARFADAAAAARYADAAAAAAARSAGYAAARSAGYAAAARSAGYAAASAAEYGKQLEGLRRIGRDWANGLPAEV
jgi:hypothetical protein